jgi:hypothetical protein
MVKAKFAAAGMHPVLIRCREGVFVRGYFHAPGCAVAGAEDHIPVIDASDVSHVNMASAAYVQEYALLGHELCNIHTGGVMGYENYSVRTLADMRVILQLCDRLNDTTAADYFIDYLGRLSHQGFYTATEIMGVFGTCNVRVCRAVLPPTMLPLLPNSDDATLRFAAAAADLNHAQTWMGAVKQAIRRTNNKTVILGWQLRQGGDPATATGWDVWMITSRDAPDGFRLPLEHLAMSIVASEPTAFGLWEGSAKDVLPSVPDTWERHNWETVHYGVDVDDRFFSVRRKPPTLVVQFSRPTVRVLYHDPDPSSPWVDLWEENLWVVG